MEDRATLRISSQHIANWLHHGITDREQVAACSARWRPSWIARTPATRTIAPMAPDFDASLGFRAALDLVFEGRDEPNGYTERVLTACRREAKAAAQGRSRP